MRPTGFILAVLLIAGGVGYAQQPGSLGQPAATPADPKLDAHLDAWEKKMSGVVNLRTEVALTRTDAVFKKPLSYTGTRCA
jgi:hypothetical protein